MEIAKTNNMIPFEEALKIVLSNIPEFGSERISLIKSLNRVLAEDITADIDMPPFPKAAMDGFACRKADLSNELEVIEEIPAGTNPLKSIGAKQCSRIMTGAMVPEGADFILMKEHVTELAGGKVKCNTSSNHANICFKGEDVKTGDIVLIKGDIILPQHIAILASVGAINPLVKKIPSVAIISTGNELVEPDQTPGVSQIRNSNGIQLTAQTIQSGLFPIYLGITTDNESSLYNILSKAINEFDIVIISGGVSVGDYDFVPKVLNKLEVEILFHGVLAKPGKHLLFGKLKNHLVFGMPGNPVSSFVQFELLVKPLINEIMGQREKSSFLALPLEKEYSRKKSNTLEFIPVSITEKKTVLPLEYHGSAHIHAYTKASGILEIPIGVNEVKKGDLVHVRPL